MNKQENKHRLHRTHLSKAYLEVTFDPTLNFKRHIKIIKAKNTKNINIIKILPTNKNGLNAEKLIKVSNTVIRSSLEYGCQIFTTAWKTTQEMLNSIYNNAIRSSIGTLRSSPIDSIHAEADTYKPNDRFYELCTRYFIKTLCNKTHPVNHLLSGISPNNNTKTWTQEMHWKTDIRWYSDQPKPSA